MARASRPRKIVFISLSFSVVGFGIGLAEIRKREYEDRVHVPRVDYGLYIDMMWFREATTSALSAVIAMAPPLPFAIGANDCNINLVS